MRRRPMTTGGQGAGAKLLDVPIAEAGRLPFSRHRLPQVSEHWLETKDGDPYAYAFFSRHYPAQGRNERRKVAQFVGPGEHMVLLGTDGLALFVWRQFINDDGRLGVNCAVFRNEGQVRSSRLLWEAMGLAWERWPGTPLYTYVDPERVQSRNPGYCFRKAGWSLARTWKGGKRVPAVTGTGKWVLEMVP